MLTFETRTGPDFGANAPVYPSNGVPDWYRDAKLGFFIHWGLYSVPAWATGQSGVPVEDAYAHHRYAEWYGNTVRIPGSPTWERHQQQYGAGTSYEDLADLWDVTGFDASSLIGEIVAAGAKYVIPTTKHHEGFCLWDTATTGFRAPRRGPRRDLIAELHDATRAAGAKFGVYFSGALDWHASDFPPIESDTDLFRFRRNDAHFAAYAGAQVDELVQRFRPDVLWNDIDWPDGGKGREPYAVAALLERYFRAVPDGVVNDRWGVPYHGFLTREYIDVQEIMQPVWESTRGLGLSFGFNQDEGADESLSPAALIRLLVEVVARNGNLLINVGPAADGSIPEIQRTAMRALGAWLATNGAAIYGTRPWIRPSEPTGVPRAYTTTGSTVHVLVLEPAAGVIELPAELAGREGRWLGADTSVVIPAEVGAAVPIPQALRAEPVAVLSVAG